MLSKAVFILDNKKHFYFIINNWVFDEYNINSIYFKWLNYQFNAFLFNLVIENYLF